MHLRDCPSFKFNVGGVLPSEEELIAPSEQKYSAELEDLSCPEYIPFVGDLEGTRR